MDKPYYFEPSDNDWTSKFNVKHSPFAIRYNLQAAILGICDMDTPIYSISKCVYLMQELGIEKFNAISMIYEYKANSVLTKMKLYLEI